MNGWMNVWPLMGQNGENLDEWGYGNGMFGETEMGGANGVIWRMGMYWGGNWIGGPKWGVRHSYDLGPNWQLII